MTDAFEQQAYVFLRKNTRFYERVVAHALRVEVQGDDERTLRWIALAAEIAWAAHPGRLSDERLEAMAVRIGRRLAVPSPSPTRVLLDGRARRVLHVATTLYGTGGHTRLLENWVRIDDSSSHSLLLLDQGRESVRAAVTDRIAASGGEMIALPAGTSRLERAHALRMAAASGYDLVVLHHHPNDVVPLVAFAHEGGPPVAVMNHADHVFWLGVSVADLVIEYRTFGEDLSRERRGAREGAMFPLPIDIDSSGPTKAAARMRLGVPDSEIMLLSIASAGKYVPTQRQHFFKTAAKLLDRHDKARLYVIGVRDDNRRTLAIPAHPRITLLGLMEDPIDYEAAADLYLESFPFGSYTALLETCARGTCPIVMHSPTAHNESARETTLKDMVISASSEEGYLAQVAELLVNPTQRAQLGKNIARRIESLHSAAALRRHLDYIYDRISRSGHTVIPLPARLPQQGRHDLDLAGFQQSRSAIPVVEWISTATITSLSLREWFGLLGMSIAARDTKLRPRHAKALLSMLKRRATAANL